MNSLTRAYTARIYLKRIEGVEEIQFRTGKKRKSPIWRAAWKRKYMSFRSTARALRNTNTNICRWHIASIAVTPENGAKHGSSCSLPSTHLSNGGPGSHSVSLSTATPSRTAILLTASSAKIVSIRIQMRPRSHHATRHIPLRHSRQFNASDEGAHSDSSIDTQHFIVISSSPCRVEIHSNFTFSRRKMIKRPRYYGSQFLLELNAKSALNYNLENVILIRKIFNSNQNKIVYVIKMDSLYTFFFFFNVTASSSVTWEYRSKKYCRESIMIFRLIKSTIKCL